MSFCDEVLHVGGSRLLVFWRTQFGKLGAAYSDDWGDSFGEPFWYTYAGPHSKVFLNPRGAFTPKQLYDGSYVMLFYNNGGTDREGYVGRRVYWITTGRTVKDHIHWAQPEIALFNTLPVMDQREDWNVFFSLFFM